MTEKKFIVRAWYWTGPPNNQHLLADFIGSNLRLGVDGVYLTCNDAWGGTSERFFANRNIVKISEEEA